MYIPQVNVFENQNEVIDFMKQFSFATIITSDKNRPVATHLPFIISETEGNIVLISHFAKANNHWKQIENNPILVIFSEPHAYISPKHYDIEQNVPTWNYISVHAYGNGKLITETEKVFEVLEKSIDNFEKSYRSQWDNLNTDYKINMAKGIVAFEIAVTDLQAKKKLSQNRSETEKVKIINSLTKSDDTNESQIGEFMKKEI